MTSAWYQVRVGASPLWTIGLVPISPLPPRFSDLWGLVFPQSSALSCLPLYIYIEAEREREAAKVQNRGTFASAYVRDVSKLWSMPPMPAHSMQRWEAEMTNNSLLPQLFGCAGEVITQQRNKLMTTLSQGWVKKALPFKLSIACDCKCQRASSPPERVHRPVKRI